MTQPMTYRPHLQSGGKPRHPRHRPLWHEGDYRHPPADATPSCIATATDTGVRFLKILRRLAPVALLVSAGISQAQNLPVDPHLRQGVLANGFHYTLRHNVHPAGQVSFRFGMKVGSFQEEAGERGFAHFIEHMAFRSTRDYPKSGIRQVFERLGLTFGDDQNAETFLSTTQYQLDLKSSTHDQIDLALSWLRNVADRVQFDPQDLSLEREVVLSEKSSTAPDRAEAVRQRNRFERPGLRSGDRDPIGLEADLRAATPQSLARFYHRWYRPQNADLVVVGDIDPVELEARIIAAFSDWSATPEPPTTRLERITAQTGPLAYTAVDPTGFGQVRACWLSEPRAAKANPTVAYRDKIRRAIATSALSNRLYNLRRTPAFKVLGGWADLEDLDPDVTELCANLTAVGDDYSQAVSVAASELARLRRDGVVEDEMDTAIELNRIKRRSDTFGSVSALNASLANALLAADLFGEPHLDPTQAMAAYDAVVETVTPKQVSDTLTSLQFAGPYLSVLAPHPPTPDALVAAWRSGQSHPANSAYTPPATPQFGYRFEPTGTVKSRTEHKDPDFVTLTFENGVVLNLKHTDFSPGQVSFDVVLGYGAQQIPPGQVLAYEVGTALFPFGGVGKHSRDELAQIFTNDQTEIPLHTSPGRFAIEKTSFRPDLEDDLKIIGAYLSDPAFETLDPLIEKTLHFALENLNRTPVAAAERAVMERIDVGGARRFPPSKDIEKINTNSIKAIIRPILVDAPIMVNIVGDTDEKAVVDAVANTLGALPSRPPLSPPKFGVDQLAFGPEPLLRVDYPGPDDKAAIVLVWPLFVAEPARRHEELTLQLVARLLKVRLDERLRDATGKVYAPQVALETPDLVEVGDLNVAVETTPANLPILADAIHQLVAELVAGNISPDAFDRVRAPALEAASADRRSNSDWALALTDIGTVTDFLSTKDIIAAITLDDVKAACAKWLARPPIEAHAFPRKTAP